MVLGNPWGMPSNFCFYDNAEKSVFGGENGNAFLDIALPCDKTSH